MMSSSLMLDQSKSSMGAMEIGLGLGLDQEPEDSPTAGSWSETSFSIAAPPTSSPSPSAAFLFLALDSASIASSLAMVSETNEKRGEGSEVVEKGRERLGMGFIEGDQESPSNSS